MARDHDDFERPERRAQGRGFSPGWDDRLRHDRNSENWGAGYQGRPEAHQRQAPSDFGSYGGRERGGDYGKAFDPDRHGNPGGAGGYGGGARYQDQVAGWARQQDQDNAEGTGPRAGGPEGTGPEQHTTTGWGTGLDLQEGYAPTGYQPRRRHDPDYQQWRAEHARSLDSDYDAWRQQRPANFSEDFNSWRAQRAQAQQVQEEHPPLEPADHAQQKRR